MKGFIALCIFILCSCQNSHKEMKKMIRLSFHVNPTTVDTRKNTDVCSSALLFMIYEGLTRLLPDGSTEAAMAKAIEISEDGKVYTFHLRNAVWSDGRPVSAHDFEYSWKKILTPSFASPCPYLFYSIRNAEEAVKGEIPIDEVAIWAIDNKTLKVELKNPTPYFLALISFCNFFPIPKHVEEEDPLWHLRLDRTLVTNGPFTLSKWIPNQEIVVIKNPLYWDVDHVKLDGIHISIIGDEKTTLKMFESGDLDLITSVTSPLSIDDLISAKEKGLIETKPMGGTLFCTFNLQHKLFQNASIRKAFAFAIDRPSIVENITQLSDTAATRFIPHAILKNSK